MSRGRISKYKNIDNENEDNNVWNAAVYIRYSHEDSSSIELSDSVVNQKKLIYDFLKENQDIKVYNSYVDDGFSGTNFNRPAIKNLLNDMKNGKINTIIVKDLSRLGRNYLEVGNYIEQIFPLFNIRFIAIMDNIDSYKNPKTLSQIIIPLKNLMNAEYSKDISQKIRSVNKIKIRKGELVSGLAPYGYIKNPNNKNALIIDLTAAEIVKKIYEMALSGMGFISICKKLYDMKILNPRSYRKNILNKKDNVKKEILKEYDYTWEISAIQRILTSEIYCGDMVQGKTKCIDFKNHKRARTNKNDWIIVRDTHEAIIDRETFKRVQENLKKRRSNNNYIKKEKTLFANYLKCGDCKKGMLRQVYTNQKGKEVTYYCSTYARRAEKLCTKHRIKGDILEKAVLKAVQLQIKLILKTDKLIEEIKSQKMFNDDEQKVNSLIKKVQNELQRECESKKSLYEQWKLDKISKEEYHKRVEQIEQNLLKDKFKLEELENRNFHINKLKNYNNAWINIFEKNNNITKLNREVIEELIEYIYIYENDKITIKFKYEDEYLNSINYLKSIENYSREENDGKKKSKYGI